MSETRSITTALLLAAGLSAFGASPAVAQSDGASPGRVDVAVGTLWVGSQHLGDQAANETTASGGQLALFTTSSDLASRAGVEGRVGVKLWPSLEVEASGTYASPEIRTQVSADFEGAAPITVTERIQQYTIAGGLVWYPVPRSASPIAPFVTAGGGYLRQLHEAARWRDGGSSISWRRREFLVVAADVNAEGSAFAWMRVRRPRAACVRQSTRGSPALAPRSSRGSSRA